MYKFGLFLDHKYKPTWSKSERKDLIFSRQLLLWSLNYLDTTTSLLKQSHICRTSKSGPEGCTWSQASTSSIM